MSPVDPLPVFQPSSEDIASYLVGRDSKNFDSIVKDKQLQQFLLAEAELKKYYVHHYEQLSHLDAKKINDVKDQHLRYLLATVYLYSQKKAADKKHDEEKTTSLVQIQESIDNVIAGVTTETSLSSGGANTVNRTEVLTQALEISDFGLGGSPILQALSTLPLVNNFISGLSDLYEAYQAYRDPTLPQRRTKMGAALFGGAVSIGVGIVGALLLAGTGLMATAGAILFAPLVATALVLGVAAVSLYRDSYILHQARLEVEKMKEEVKRVDEEFAQAKEIIISRYFSQPNLGGSLAITSIQAIQEKITKLYGDLKRPGANTEQIKIELQQEIALRNRLINADPAIKKQVQDQFLNDPKLYGNYLQRSNLNRALRVLKESRGMARYKTVLSAITFVAISLLLTAALLTGIGAFVIAGIATVALAGVAISRVYTKLKAKPKTVQLPEPVLPVEIEKPVRVHTSSLDIEDKLLNHQHDKIADALHQEIKPQSSEIHIEVKDPVKESEDEREPLLSKEEDMERKDAPSPH